MKGRSIDSWLSLVLFSKTFYEVKAFDLVVGSIMLYYDLKLFKTTNIKYILDVQYPFLFYEIQVSICKSSYLCFSLSTTYSERKI